VRAMTRILRGISVLIGLALVGSVVPVVAGEVASPSPVASVAPSPLPSVAPEVSAAPEASSSPMEPVATPSLPEDLPRKKAADVPLFVGPATLRVSGKRGAYRWDKVHFGTGEVEARVALTPKNAACVARVRLTEDGGSVLDEWFSVDSGVKEAHEAVLSADYVTGKLKVDSDCASWSVRFEPIDDPDLEVTIKEKSYPVRGDTVAELEAGTKHIKGKWAAYTKWVTNWVYWTGEADDGDSCDVVSGETSVEVVMTMPKWKTPKGVAPAVVAEWERIYENLRVHELGHVTIALQGADAIDDRLDRGFSAVTCKKVGRVADDKAKRIFKRHAKASQRYDKETGHGRTQGTWFK